MAKSSVDTDRPPRHFSTEGETTVDETMDVERLAHRYGKTFDSYLVVEPDRDYFWSDNRCGVVAFTERGRYVHIVGGLLAEASDQAELLAQFVEFALSRRKKRMVAFYNTSVEDLPPFEQAGFQITKCGEEPWVDLIKTTWSGKAYEWVRRQENFCKRHGLTCEELTGDGLAGRAGELSKIAQEHVERTHHGQEMAYFVSRFDPYRLGRRRVFAAIKEGGLEGFIVCNPCLGGRKWAIETYRRRDDATRGVVPFIMLQAMRLMKLEDVEAVSLSLVPALRAEEARAGDSWLFRWGQVIWWRHMNWVFDMRGIYHYKSRFRPDFDNMYVAAFPRLTPLSLLSFFRTWRMFNIPPYRLAANVVRKRRKSRARSTLAKPTVSDDTRPGVQ